MATNKCFWGFKHNEDQVRQCLTACINPKIYRVVTDEFCVACPFRSTSVAEKLSKAIAELRKSKRFREIDFYTKNEMVVVMGKEKFAVLEYEESNGLMIWHYPEIRYTFEGCRIIFSPNPNGLMVAIVDKFSGAVLEKKEVKD